MKTCVVLQPSFMPWIGYLEQILRSDVFVFFCSAQYTKNDWRNRNRIKTHNGWIWLTVPATYSYPDSIAETKIDNSCDWRGNHFKTIQQYYAKARYFKKYRNTLEEFYSREYDTIEQIAESSIKMICGILGLNPVFLCSKNIEIPAGDKSEKLLNICKYLGADSYYCGKASKGYLDEDLMLNNGVDVRFQNYQHPVYTQLHGEFISYLSVLDLILNEGPKSLEIIRGKRP